MSRNNLSSPDYTLSRFSEDEDFPEHLLILIADIIDPYGTDTEVQRLLCVES